MGRSVQTETRPLVERLLPGRQEAVTVGFLFIFCCRVFSFFGSVAKKRGLERRA